MFLNDNQYFYVYLYWGYKPNGTYMSHACKSIPPKKIIYLFFILFKCTFYKYVTKMFFILTFLYLGVAHMSSKKKINNLITKFYIMS